MSTTEVANMHKFVYLALFTYIHLLFNIDPELSHGETEVEKKAAEAVSINANASTSINQAGEKIDLLNSFLDFL